MTSAEGEAGRHSQRLGMSGAGIGGTFYVLTFEGSLKHSRPCPALDSVELPGRVCGSVFMSLSSFSATYLPFRVI